MANMVNIPAKHQRVSTVIVSMLMLSFSLKHHCATVQRQQQQLPSKKAQTTNKG